MFAVATNVTAGTITSSPSCQPSSSRSAAKAHCSALVPLLQKIACCTSCSAAINASSRGRNGPSESHALSSTSAT
jgi:hypothetical protein